MISIKPFNHIIILSIKKGEKGKCVFVYCVLYHDLYRSLLSNVDIDVATLSNYPPSEDSYAPI